MPSILPAGARRSWACRRRRPGRRAWTSPGPRSSACLRVRGYMHEMYFQKMESRSRPVVGVTGWTSRISTGSLTSPIPSTPCMQGSSSRSFPRCSIRVQRELRLRARHLGPGIPRADERHPLPGHQARAQRFPAYRTICSGSRPALVSLLKNWTAGPATSSRPSKAELADGPAQPVHPGRDVHLAREQPGKLHGEHHLHEHRLRFPIAASVAGDAWGGLARRTPGSCRAGRSRGRRLSSDLRPARLKRDCELPQLARRGEDRCPHRHLCHVSHQQDHTEHEGREAIAPKTGAPTSTAW